MPASSTTVAKRFTEAEFIADTITRRLEGTTNPLDIVTFTNQVLIAINRASKAELMELDYYGLSIAHIAAKYGQDKILERLVEKCPKLLHLGDRRGLTPLYYVAFKEPKKSTYALLLKHYPADALWCTNAYGFSPLHNAVRYASTQTVKHLLSLIEVNSLNRSALINVREYARSMKSVDSYDLLYSKLKLI